LARTCSVAVGTTNRRGTATRERKELKEVPLIVATGDAVQVVSGRLASALARGGDGPGGARLRGHLLDHISGAANKHAAAHITSTPRGFIVASDVQAAIDELVGDLSSATVGTPGASKVGADGVAGTPNALPAGNVDGQLAQLLTWLNNHVGAAARAHAASAIAGARPQLRRGHDESPRVISDHTTQCSVRRMCVRRHA
jgi:hypothetical protein